MIWKNFAWYAFSNQAGGTVANLRAFVNPLRNVQENGTPYVFGGWGQTVFAPNVIYNVNSNPMTDGVWQVLPFWLAFTIWLPSVWVYVATNVWCENCPMSFPELFYTALDGPINQYSPPTPVLFICTTHAASADGNQLPAGACKCLTAAAGPPEHLC